MKVQTADIFVDHILFSQQDGFHNLSFGERKLSFLPFSHHFGQHGQRFFATHSLNVIILLQGI